MHVLVLAGGEGSRLWPYSKKDCPKQFLHFGDGESFLQKTLLRFLDASFTSSIVVVTNIHYKSHVQKQLQEIGALAKVKVLVEPEPRGTAAAIGLALIYLKEKLGATDASSVLILPSDHIVTPQNEYIALMKEMEPLIADSIATFGIRPHRPESGYGYIQLGNRKNSLFFDVKRFIEKPDRETARTYMKSGDYLWNSGMFACKIGTFFQELQTHASELFSFFIKGYAHALKEFSLCPKLSVDYALMEKTKKITVCPMNLRWLDVGSWDSVYEFLDKDSNQNVKRGNVLDIETTNSLIIGGKRLIFTVGLKDILIVETEDALFLAKKGESQKVKNLIENLKSKTVSSIQTNPIYKKPEKYAISRHTVEPNQLLKVTSGHWTVLSGEILAVLAEETRSLKAGQSLDLGSVSFQYWKNSSSESVDLLEVEVFASVKELPQPSSIQP